MDTLEVQTASYQQTNMMNYIFKKVKEISPDAEVNVDEGNIYVTKGSAKTYPCVASHMDTVHSLHPNSRVFNFNGKLFSVDFQSMKRIGTGGDDKVGVFVCLEMLRQFDNIKLVFFRDEEVGCLGSSKADMNFFEDVSLVMQCDRKGYKDFVNSISGTKLYTKEFSEAIQETLKKWGKKETSGGLTDVYQLAENGVGVCVANMSCGYHDPHTDNEYCIVNQVMDTSDFVKDLILAVHVDGETWDIKHDVWSSYRSYGGWDGYEGQQHSYNKYGGGWTSNITDAKWITPPSEEDDDTNVCPCCNEDYATNYDDMQEEWYCYTCRGYFSELVAIMSEVETRPLGLPESSNTAE